MEQIVIKNGNTFRALGFEIKRGDTAETLAPVNLNNCTLRCQFKIGSKRGKLIKDVRSGEGITHLDPALGVAQIDQFDMVLPVADVIVYFDVELTDNNLTPPLVDTIIENTVRLEKVVTTPKT